MEKFKFNLNDPIYVKIFEDGYQYMADRDNEFLAMMKMPLHSVSHYRKKADETGYTKFQAWEFIQTFGPVVKMGGKQYFDINILLEINKSIHRD